MADHNVFGKEAVRFLKEKGYKILETNWRYLKAEIDIIALKGKELVIIEVKARKNDFVRTPEEAVSYKKKKLLLTAADFYVTSNHLNYEIKFDIISLLRKEKQWKNNHIENAFDSLL